ncbi:GNAT family N-acetyltransferase [Pedococcus sp. KACC 23699]|uniref:GNAT family N-acetyltransferase n=1 Tax=Pedococcus sp. KACC 23699 TaxID=3149228 RepID=A0AAU7JNY3_9MICO
MVRDQWRLHRAVRLAMLLDVPRAYGSTFAREIAFDDQVWLDRIRDGSSWLALQGDLPLGSVTLFHAPSQPDDEASLVAMWVAAHARGTGVADALVGALLEHAAALGLRRITLDVADENGRAGAFYERLGFVRTGRTGELPHFPGVGEFEMERVLCDRTAFPR